MPGLAVPLLPAHCTLPLLALALDAYHLCIHPQGFPTDHACPQEDTFHAFPACDFKFLPLYFLSPTNKHEPYSSIPCVTAFSAYCILLAPMPIHHFFCLPAYCWLWDRTPPFFLYSSTIFIPLCPRSGLSPRARLTMVPVPGYFGSRAPGISYHTNTYHLPQHCLPVCYLP